MPEVIDRLLPLVDAGGPIPALDGWYVHAVLPTRAISDRIRHAEKPR